MRNVRAILSVAMFVPALASAQEAAPAAAAPAASVASISPFGNIKGQMVLSDSERGDTPDINVNDLNLGVNVSKGLGSATAKIHYEAHNAGWNVREANARLNFPFGLELGLGRFDNGITDRQDALKLGYSLKMSDTQNFGGALYYGPTFEGSKNYGDRTPQTQWRAFGVVLNAKFNEIFANLKYGNEANRLVSEEAVANTAIIGAVAPWSKVNLEAGWDNGMIGGKGYVISTTTGKAKAIVPDTKANVRKTQGDAVGEENKELTLGGEMWGDSKVWGMSGIFAAEDKLTYGAVLELYSQDYKGGIDADGKKEDKKGDTKILVKGGYSTGAMGTWLELETHSSDKKVYKDAKGKFTKTKSLLTLNMEYGF